MRCERGGRTVARIALPASPFGLDAAGGERLRFSGADFLVKASADTTGGSFSIVEEIEPLDTPLHVHEHEDEIFYVLEGEHVFAVGTRSSMQARAGWSTARAACRTPSGASSRVRGGR
ncbi:MAG TPA: hypothetical protein VK387_02260 [Thermoleophilaceae bacterium]|nr:hypothetical protein [Thermoleophilaceae bacterium]